MNAFVSKAWKILSTIVKPKYPYADTFNVFMPVNSTPTNVQAQLINHVRQTTEYPSFRRQLFDHLLQIANPRRLVK